MLPTLPINTNKWAKSYKRQQEIVAFRGLNRTQNTQEGEFSHAQNLSTANFPTLTQRGKRTAITGYSNPTDIFAWDGHLVVVDGGILYYDGTAKDNVSPGKKQFAVVNTKLCIWPDKTYIDLTNGSYGHLDVFLQTSGTYTITSNTFSSTLNQIVQQNIATSTFSETGRSTLKDIWTYTYGSNPAAVAACWTGSAWSGLSSLQEQSAIYKGGQDTPDRRQMVAGDIFIPTKTGNAFDMTVGKSGYGGNPSSPSVPDTSRYNTEGYYGIVKSIALRYIPEDDYGPDIMQATVTFDLYRVTTSGALFSGTFKVGDVVSFTGGPSGYNVTHAKITGISSSPNTLTFAANTFPGSTTASSTVTIRKDVPDLDYICEKDNRLWGVSNSLTNTVHNAETGADETFTSRAIYASALGDPADWWTFSGIDTDAYQVAVGSEGDFTGICSYGGAVCCWKEDRLYKILGNYPSEYYMHDSRIEGVAAGSYRSMTIVNEVLYYNGATGIYAYTGSTPTLIGYPLGTLYKDASAGSNGLRWYFSGKKPDNTTELVVYDLTHRIWTREDGSNATAFALIGSNLYMLTDTGIYMVEQGADSSIAWEAEFVPFDETALIRKYYLRLLLRLEMSAGSSVTVQVRQDTGAWKTLLDADTDVALVKSVEVPPHRCDKLTVRLTGTGNVLLRHMTREYIVGSERP